MYRNTIEKHLLQNLRGYTKLDASEKRKILIACYNVGHTGFIDRGGKISTAPKETRNHIRKFENLMRGQKR